MFASMTAGYESLSDSMGSFISELVAVHDFTPFRTPFGENESSKNKLRELEDRFPNPLHPVVRIHPETGRRVLYVNPQFTVRMQGLSDHESRNVLDALFEQAKIPEHQLRLAWEPGMVVFWDNRSVQHYAVHDYYPQRRRMERVTLRGERPLGPSAPDLPDEWPRRNRFSAPSETVAQETTRQFQR